MISESSGLAEVAFICLSTGTPDLLVWASPKPTLPSPALVVSDNLTLFCSRTIYLFSDSQDVGRSTKRYIPVPLRIMVTLRDLSLGVYIQMGFQILLVP